MEKKKLSDGKKFLVILIFSISAIFFGILLSFFIKFLYYGITMHDNEEIYASLIFFIFPFTLGVIFFITLAILLRSYDKNKKEKNRKWYVDKILLALMIVWITVAMVFFSFGYENDEGIYLIFSLIIFLLIGILTTPNIVLYALNDMKNWKNIFSNRGNLSRHKRINNFYMMHAPVSFEKKIYFAVLKEQILNIFTVVIFIMIFLSRYLFLASYSGEGSVGNIIYALMHTKAVRAEGYLFFGSVFIAAFWIPMFAYYITNAIYKLRVVRKHKYIAYHAVVDKVDTFKIRINNSGFNYSYDYCICVGIKAKNVNKTSAILIFVPDDLLLFPDDEKNKN